MASKVLLKKNKRKNGFGFKQKKQTREVICLSSMGLGMNDETFGRINVIKSPTGSGKTFAMIDSAIKEASHGGVVVICFPNLNLVNENITLLKGKLADDGGNEKNIDVFELTLNEYGSEDGVKSTSDLLTKIMKGRLIIVTLHTYITQRGDYGNYSSLLMLLQPFKGITTIFVDEAHLLFDSYQRTYSLTNLVSHEKGQYRIIYSGRKLEEVVKDGKTVFVTPQTLQSSKIPGGKDIGYKLTSPFDIYQQSSDLDFVEASAFDASYTTQPPLLTNSPSQKKEESSLVLGSVDMKFPLSLADIENSGISQEAKDHLLKSQTNAYVLIKEATPALDLGTKLENKYYDLFLLSITGDLEKDAEIKNFLATFYQKFFLFNSYLTLMNTYDSKAFNKSIAAAYNNADDSYNLEELSTQLFGLNVKFVQTIMDSLKTTFDNEMAVRKSFNSAINPLAQNFIEILVKSNRKFPLKPILPESELEALSMNYVFSKNTSILNFKPLLIERVVDEKGQIFVKRETLDSFDRYVNKLKEKFANDARKEESKDSNVREPVEDSGEESPPEPQDARGPEGNLVNESNNSIKLQYIDAVPFTTQLNCYFLGDFYRYSGFKNVYFLSATYSTPNLNTIRSSVNDVQFIEFNTKRDKLNKLVLIKSSIDWFANANSEWKRNWKDFADFFYTTFSFGRAEVDKKYGLFLTPSNSDAEYFHKYKITKPDNRYSLVKGGSESYVDFSKAPSLTEQTGFSVKPTLIENRVIRISSILSTIAVGLNMPEHVFILAAANSFKPVSIVWKYGDIPITDVRNYETTLALIQAIGRNARKSQKEIETSAYTARCVLISKADTFPNTVETLAQYSSQFYEDVETLDITPIEALIGSNTKSAVVKISYQNLTKFKTNREDIYMQLFPFGSVTNSQDIRFALIKQVLTSLSLKEVGTYGIYSQFMGFVARFRILSVCSFLTTLTTKFIMSKQNLNAEHQEAITAPPNGKKNPNQSKILDEKVSKRDLTKKFNINRWSPFEKHHTLNKLYELYSTYFDELDIAEQLMLEDEALIFCNIFEKCFYPYILENLNIFKTIPLEEPVPQTQLEDPQPPPEEDPHSQDEGSSDESSN